MPINQLITQRRALMLAAAAAVLGMAPVRAADATAAADQFTIEIRGNRFEPAEVKVPAGRKVKLVVKNLDATAEEFESHELNREKIVPPGGAATIYIGPLKPGKYPFFGEFNPKTAQGVVIVE